MSASPFLGVFLLALCGVAGGSFYVPFGKIRRWSWETSWLVLCVPACVVVPWLVGWLTVPHLLEVLQNSPTKSLVLAFLFGAMWGVGSNTFGLTIRYLGISLGTAIATGLCAAFGTLIPPVIDGQFIELLTSFSGQVVLVGVAVSMAGIAVCGYAGVCKERELDEGAKQETVKEFALGKGFAVATVAGVMSAFMVYGINAGVAITQVATDRGTSDIYKNNPTFIVILAGGFLVQLIWCLTLNVQNRTIREYAAGPDGPLAANYLLATLAGTLSVGQLFLYGMGATKMGEYAFSSWSVQTALTLIFSTFWGIALKEWNGVSPRTLLLLGGSVLILILSVIIMSAGSYLATTGY
jgi:L-rhamnose-H+ transport protein